MEDAAIDLRRQIIEEQMAAWRVNLERTCIQNEVALGLEDKKMQARAQQETARCVKAIKCLAALLKELDSKEIPNA